MSKEEFISICTSDTNLCEASIEVTKLLTSPKKFIRDSKFLIQVEVDLPKYMIKNCWVQPSSLRHDLEKILRRGVGLDIQFITSNDKSFCAHKAIIEIRAPHLFNLLLNDTEEINEIRLPDKIDTEAFGHLLQFIYTDYIDKIF